MQRTDTRRVPGAAWGVAAMVAASTIWGLSALFYKLLTDVPATEVLAHRTIWSALLFVAWLALRGRLRELGALVDTPRQAGLLIFAAAMISINWFVFILAVQTGHVVETSLGYYIFPLVSAALGVALFAERPGAAQLAAMMLGAAAVAVLIIGLGVTPWVSLILAVSFGLYGAAKKALKSGAVVSVTGEVLILLPIAIAWFWFEVPGRGSFSGGTALLLVATGPLTAVPLMFFSVATRRLSLASVGIIGYLNPTLQFLCATIAFSEPFGIWHSVAFALIWLALALYSGAALMEHRRITASAPARPASPRPSS